jgi:citronellol/citronellal dehydrogenase
MTIFKNDILMGEVALVTGGGSGIGAGIARRLADQGAKVVLVGRKLDKLAGVASEIEARGGKALALPEAW